MEEKIFFNNTKRDKLCGILSSPKNKKINSIIILCHGFSSQKNSGSNLAISDKLKEVGFATFRFDFFAHGESDGLFENLTITEAVEDVLSAINYLKNQGYKKIGLEGSSFGGGAALMAASRSKDIYVVAVKCPVSSYLEFRDYTNPELIANWKKVGYAYRENKKLNYSFYKDIQKNIVYEVAKNIKIPTLIVHGDADMEVSVNQSIKTAGLIPNCNLEIIKGANHYFEDKKHFEKMVNLITNFVISNSK